jgi:gluconolactonase
MHFRFTGALVAVVMLAACGGTNSPTEPNQPGSGGSGGGSGKGGGAGMSSGATGGSGVGGSAGTATTAGKGGGGGGTGLAGSGGSPAAGVGGSNGSAGTGGSPAGAGGGGAGISGSMGGAPGGGQGGANAGAGGAALGGAGQSAGGGSGGGSTLHGGASGTFVCAPGATYGNPLTGMGSVTTIGPPTMGTPNYFAFIEGPVWIGSLGKLFFSDNVSPERIWELTPGGTPSVFQEMTNSNGLALDGNDQIVITDQEKNRITRVDPTSTTAMQVVIGSASCKPNDAVVRSDGNIYYSAPNQTGTGFYRMTPDGMIAETRTDVMAPNGIDLSPDENTLYVGDVNNQSITKFTLDGTGKIGATGSPFAKTMNTTADGMCVDCAGDVYIGTSNGIEVFAPDGTALGIVPTGESSNCTFGGTDRKTMYVTSRSQLKAVTLAVPGLPD